MRQRSVIAALCALLLAGALPASAKDRYTSDTDELVEAVERLPGKSLPQAYFWLDGPRVPSGICFAPDGKGGAYILIWRYHEFPADTTPEDLDRYVQMLRKEMQERGQDPSVFPVADHTARRVVYWPDAAWTRLETAMAKWSVPIAQVAAIQTANVWRSPAHLAFRIPPGQERAVVVALIKDALGLAPATFTCAIHMN